MARPIAKALAGFVLVAFICLLFALFLALRNPNGTSPALPNPNGYDDFRRAGSLIRKEDYDFTSVSGEQLRTVVASNAEPLRLLRLGLTRPCRVPLESSVDGPHFKGLPLLKRAAQLLVAEGRLAESEERFAAAADSYLTAIRMGQEVQRGGIMIDALVGIATESLGVAAAEKLVQHLEAAPCRNFAVALQTAEPLRESSRAVLQTEKIWARRMAGWRYPVYAVAALINYKSTRLTEQRYIGRATTAQLRTRQLTTTLAARAYRLEKGQPPQSWADLVPGYLKSIPVDPSTGSNMVFYP